MVQMMGKDSIHCSMGYAASAMDESEAHTWAYNDIVWAALLLPGVEKGPVVVLIDKVLPIIGHRDIATQACLHKVLGAGHLVEVQGIWSSGGGWYPRRLPGWLLQPCCPWCSPSFRPCCACVD